ncbi:amidohydrolase [Pseudochryseolinea flava]|uniref:Amidohydrolase n=1 Tax=Pseudochryseolinea flava TaxID=2059302 RepID=A0A364YBX3_9BACT|nr:amidohydrolase [Pseudochryseolinea flava]RAW03258.1 amidohydrolase [Pseudochryseolinea flava]
MKSILFLLLIVGSFTATGQVNEKVQTKVLAQAQQLEGKVIEWRRHIHQYPELSNREFKTGAYVEKHLRALGLEVQTGIAHTGVVGLLKTGKPGPVIALRADMDALPVTERNNLPFASKETTTFNGQETGVMHACGHDSHVAILMGVAEILVKNKTSLRGTIKFIFQPAEEGPPAGEKGGAPLMVEEGVLENPKVDVIFGLHIQGIRKLGQIAFKPNGMMASSDWFTIKVTGKQAHGAAPWLGVDPIVVSAQIINGLQTIISRQTQLTKEPAVISVGMINAGIRQNIIPETAEMSGTIRTFDPAMQKEIHEKIKRTATLIAESAGAKAEVEIINKTPVTFNDAVVTEKVASSLVKAVGEQNVVRISPDTGAEDFAFFQQKVPGFFFFVGACPPEVDPAKAPSHHTPDFMMDERGMLPGLKAMLMVTLDYMHQP